jgi:GntR family transcriptional regulator
MQDLKTRAKQPAANRAPKYVMIRKWLSRQIAEGVFARGEQLPSEHELMARFGCSRVTVRQAFDDLRRLGAVESRRGKGYFVSRLTAVHNLQRLQSFGEIMAPLGVETRSDVLSISEQAASRDVAAALDLTIGDPVISIERLRIASGTIMSLDISFFPIDVGSRLSKLDLSHQDVFLLLEQQLETELGFADVTIDVMPASEPHAKLIGVATGDQIMRIRRLTYDSTGRAIDYERIFARLDTIQFHARLGRW